MSANFEFFVNSQTPKNTDPKITVRRQGVLVLNEKAAKMLGDNVTHVQIGYDEKKKAVGICAAEDDAAGRYTLRDLKNSTFLINAKPMFKHYGVEIERAQRYDVETFSEGLIGVTLPA